MCTKNEISVKNIKISIPLEIIHGTLTEECVRQHKVCEWQLEMGDIHDNAEENESVKMLTFVENGFLTLQLDCMRLVFHDEFYTCKFIDIYNKDKCAESDSIGRLDNILKRTSKAAAFPSVTDIGTQTDVCNLPSKPELDQSNNGPPKRKRGRPRLIDKQVKTNVENDNTSTKTVSKSIEISESETAHSAASDEGTSDKIITNIYQDNLGLSSAMEQEQHPDIQKPRRYGLRGAKLNKLLMNAEKGIDGSSAHDMTEDEMLDEPEILDADYNPENEGNLEDADEENLEPRQKIPMKENLNHQSVNGIIENAKPKGVRKKKKPGVLACKICNKLLCDYTGVYNHVLRKHSRRKNITEYLEELKLLKIAKCEECGLEYPDSLRLRQHIETKHQDSEPRICNICQKTFKNEASLKTHIKCMHVLDQTKSNLCHLCTASFKTSSNLRQHIKQTHLRKRDFACKICLKTFCSRAQVTRHARSHGLDESKRVYCNICNKSFLFEFNLKRHLESVHSQHSETFHCSYCGKGFCHKSGMITHVQTVHFNLFAYTCKECSASFPKSSLLKTHMMSSHGQTDFQVPELPSKNSAYDTTAENMFYCSFCSSGFKHKAKLVDHMHSDHSTAFPHMCSICNQGFLEKSFLDVHNMRAHGIVTLESENSENGQIQTGERSADIFQLITTKSGSAGKIVAIQSEQSTNQNMIAVSSDDMTDTSLRPIDSSTVLVQVADGSITRQFMVQAPDGIMTNEAMTDTSLQPIDSSTVLVQVADGSITRQFMVQASDGIVTNEAMTDTSLQSIDSSTVLVQVSDGSITRQFMVQASDGIVTNEAVVQDISNILMAAGQTLQADSSDNGIHEINLVIENPNEMNTELTEVSGTILMTENREEFIAETQTSDIVMATESEKNTDEFVLTKTQRQDIVMATQSEDANTDKYIMTKSYEELNNELNAGTIIMEQKAEAEYGLEYTNEPNAGTIIMEQQTEADDGQEYTNEPNAETIIMEQQTETDDGQEYTNEPNTEAIIMEHQTEAIVLTQDGQEYITDQQTETTIEHEYIARPLDVYVEGIPQVSTEHIV